MRFNGNISLPDYLLRLWLPVLGIFLVGGGCGTTQTSSDEQTQAIDLVDARAAKKPPGTPGGGGGGRRGRGDAPVADAGTNQQADAGVLVFLDGSASWDPDGDALTYEWRQRDKWGQVDLQNASSAIASFYAPEFPGDTTLRFRLTVSDGSSSASDNVQVTVLAAATPGDPPSNTNTNGPGGGRTADMPDSWLVLYNVDNAESVIWKDWYIQQWGIPSENTLGLHVDPVLERIHESEFHAAIFYVVSDHLNNNPDLAARVMGILVGYRVPGTFYRDSTSPSYPGGGGWSVANKLQNLDPANLNTVRWPTNPHFFVASESPDPVRVTKATLAVDTYITARIDAPTLAEAQALTVRARAISGNPGPLPADEWLYHDYQDPGSPGGGEWVGLRATVQNLALSSGAGQLPWRAFQSDGPDQEPTPNATVRFCYYQLFNWHLADWGGTPAGTRILAFALNSFGATTVRSTTDHGGRYVPNALFNGGYAGAVGATAEPYLSTVPSPCTMVWCLAEGRTLGEAVFHANQSAGWMWELVGDPLLTVPQWFQP